MKIYNTLTRKKEEYESTGGGREVRMYSCGPTVYNYAHIGNMRTYVFMDLLRRTFKYLDYNLFGVMNITDVGHLLSDADEGEDKMQKAAREQHKSPYEIAEFYTKAFFEDFGRLNIGRPELVVKATDEIDAMIAFVQKLVSGGYAYETSDGIYFDISKAKDYGKLSGAVLDERQAGARVEVNSEKRHPADFALWKKAPKEHLMQWKSPWGMGYPGWHIECSTMCNKYLGARFDIHTGGVDHIPIHHENEIAQSEAANGCVPAKYWMHGEFMLVDGGKMSKSLGNVYTVSDLQAKGYSPMVFRLFCLNAHYRKKLNFTFEGMDAAKVSYERLKKAAAANKNSDKKTDPEVMEGFKKQFLNAVEDDLNIPAALGVLWTMLKLPPSKDVYNTMLDFDRVFGLSLDKTEEELNEAEIPDEIREMAEKMQKARLEKDYATADALRAKIGEAGYMVLNKKDGYELKSKN